MKLLTLFSISLFSFLFTSCAIQKAYYPVLFKEKGNTNVYDSQVSYQTLYTGYEVGAYKFLVEVKNSSKDLVTISPNKWILRSVVLPSDSTLATTQNYNSSAVSTKDTLMLQPRTVSPINPEEISTALLLERQNLIQAENPYIEVYIPGQGTVALLGVIADIKNPPSDEERRQREQEEIAEANREYERQQNEMMWEQKRQRELVRNEFLSRSIQESSLYQAVNLQPDSTLKGYLYFSTIRNAKKLELVINDDGKEIRELYLQKE